MRGVGITAVGGESTIADNSITRCRYGIDIDGSEWSCLVEGNVITECDGQSYGAAVRIKGWDYIVTFTDNVINDNVTGYGSGVCLLGQEGTAVITDNIMAENHSEGGSGGAGVYFGMTDSTVTISGNTFARNRCGKGGACYTEGANSSAVIAGNHFEANRGGKGGAILCDTAADIADNVFASNWASYDAGAIQVRAPAVTIANNLFVGNCVSIGGYGAGGAVQGSGDVTLANCTFVGNKAQHGGAIGIYYATGAVRNCIFYQNVGYDGDGAVFPVNIMSYCALTTTVQGEGIIRVQTPCFPEVGHWHDNDTPSYPDDDYYVYGDYHLKSPYGRWDPRANNDDGGWVYDSVSSPCIDRGDPASVYAEEPMPNFGRINMGAYGNTAEASKSGWNIPGDVNGDCDVDILDLLSVRNLIGHNPSTGNNWKADVVHDASINIQDLIYVRNHLYTECE
jgi:parallel beta-helix repeat protein